MKALNCSVLGGRGSISFMNFHEAKVTGVQDT